MERFFIEKSQDMPNCVWHILTLFAMHIEEAPVARPLILTYVECLCNFDKPLGSLA